jgi:hypothetical protein
MKKIYIVCEYSDYGLVDMSEAKAFDTFEAAIETTFKAALIDKYEHRHIYPD